MPICQFTGKSFEVSPQEIALRKKLGIEGEPTVLPAFRFLQLGAFWQHWALHHRQCDRTKKPIISVFGTDCPYPVWHKDEWVKNADPPGADFDSSKPVFPQMWEFFQKSPIAHNMGTGSENCEYTDDWWYSKNCYLSHSGAKCEDLRYCYRTLGCKDSWYCVFSSDIELCTDCVNSKECFQMIAGIHSKQCRDSAFLFDCRNLENCLFCWNLRNKKYCYLNEQLTKEEFEQKKASLNLSSRIGYEKAMRDFSQIILEKAWLRATYNFLCENVTGNYLESCKDLQNCFFITESQDAMNCFRAYKIKDCLDGVSVMTTDLTYYSSSVQDQCYDVKFGYNMIQCKFAEYSAHCFQCQNIFGCCGLVGKKYHILNKPYSPEEYHELKAKIIAHMKKIGEYGQFFPGYFAANPYEESLSEYYFPLPKDQIGKYGFRVREKEEVREHHALPATDVPDLSAVADRTDSGDESLYTKVFWDDVANRLFQIQKADVVMARKLGVPLPSTYYTRRLQDNFRWMPFSGTLRTTVCGICKKGTQTSWPEKFDGRIVCETCYLNQI